jgi:prepilin-type N-terminal cleavage/methylation domain-containing protein
MKSRKKDSAYGFTLIEVIITLVIIAVVAAMMTAYFGTGITQSSLPIFRLKASARLNDVMEKISIQYGQYPQWQKYTTYALNTIIVPTPANRTGLLYKATTAGTSAATEPTWFLPTGAKPEPYLQNGKTFNDNTVTWTLVWPDGTGTPPNVAAPTLALHNSWLASRQYSTVTPATITYPGNGYQYIRITTGTSGTSIPGWSSAITSGSTVTDGTGTPVTWQCIGQAPTYTLALTGTVTVYTGGLTEAIANADFCAAANCDNKFGRYRIIDNKFIRFLSNNEDPDPAYNPLPTTNLEYGKYLKVTLGLRTDDADADKTGTLTTLFVLR